MAEKFGAFVCSHLHQLYPGMLLCVLLTALASALLHVVNASQVLAGTSLLMALIAIPLCPIGCEHYRFWEW